MYLTYFIQPTPLQSALLRALSIGSYVKTKIKSIRPRLRPIWDWSCYRTAISDLRLLVLASTYMPSNPNSLCYSDAQLSQLSLTWHTGGQAKLLKVTASS